MNISLLDELKSMGRTCPICRTKTSVDLSLKTDLNSHNYILLNYEYPLKFVRAVPLGGVQEEIIVNENDRASMPHGTVEVRIRSHCREHYLAHFLTLYLGANSEVKDLWLGGMSNMGTFEEARMDEFIIRNTNDARGPRTAVLIDVPRIGWFWDKPLKTLFTIPMKPFDFWPLKNHGELREKIEKLLLLI